jgi:oxygen-independent coproporphyrinogen-3 oxidase
LGFSAYIHLPYCLQKCPYCDFNTYAVHDFPETRYVDALVREIEWAADDQESWASRKVSTVFFGGGTPSLFSPESIARIVRTLESNFGLSGDCEVTLEANPGSLEGGGREKLAEFRAAGVNRLSLGGQSFHPKHLQTLGRVHDAGQTEEALAAARNAGFDNLSCDLMFAIPGQTLEEWRADLAHLASFGPEHVAAYNLTYESGTPMTGLLAAGRIEPAHEELERSMFECAIETLADGGYRHYEISNFAREGRQARHNLSYWTWRDYLGLGAGAHGFVRRGGVSEAWGARYANHRLPEHYMSARPGAWADKRELVGREAAISEYVMLGLRLLDGFPAVGFEATFGADFEQAVPEFQFLCEAGFVERVSNRVRLTRAGLMLADTVISKMAASVLPG